MILQNIDFGNALCASGTLGFFGEGYWFHKIPWPFGPNFDGCTFVAKTTTLLPRAGNMPRNADGLTPREWKPRCIKANLFKGVALNAVGLSGPGASALFESGRWQQRTRPFFLSFMSVAKTAQERKEELREFVALFKKHLPGFRARVGLEINFSCPNAGVHAQDLVNEVSDSLDIAYTLGIPLVPKFAVNVPVADVYEVSLHQACDAICVSNTILWGAMPERIDWQGLFGTSISPLADMGGGGLSGYPLLPLVVEWLNEARRIGIKKPINAGGGILSPDDAGRLIKAGASSIFIGSMAFLRPWNVHATIDYTDWLFERRKLHGAEKQFTFGC